MAEAEIREFLESEDEMSSSSSSTSSSSTSSSDDNHERVGNFVDIIKRYSGEDFKRNLRLTCTTANDLIDLYSKSEHFDSNENKGLAKILPEKEVYVFLWYMANTNTFREIGNLFGICKSTAWNIITRVSKWLISIGHKYISWPNPSQALTNATHFEEKTRIPGIIGCIDGTHIAIKPPKNNKESYCNRKKCYSISLQAVVDFNKKFISVSCGEPGSLHDSRVLRRSDFYQQVHADVETFFPNQTYLLGDSAYPSLDWLVTPFRDNGRLSPSEKKFNAIHSSGRVNVEHAFGLLKTRFRRLLHFTEQTDTQNVVNLVICGCVLHNMCLENGDIYEIECLEANISSSENSEGSRTVTSSSRREQLVQLLMDRNIL